MEIMLKNRTIEILGKILPQDCPLSPQEIFNLVESAYDRAMFEHLVS